MKHNLQVRLSQHLSSWEHFHGLFRRLLTCYEADGGAVTAAQLWVPPSHHGDPEIVIPCRQQVSYSLENDKRQRAAQETIRQHETWLLKHDNIYKPRAHTRDAFAELPLLAPVEIFVIWHLKFIQNSVQGEQTRLCRVCWLPTGTWSQVQPTTDTSHWFPGRWEWFPRSNLPSQNSDLMKAEYLTEKRSLFCFG